MRGISKKRYLINPTPQKKKLFVSLIYFAAFYISLEVLSTTWYSNFLGVLFLIAGLYGVVAMKKGFRFIFK